MTQQLTAATGHCRLQAASEHEVVKHSSCPAGAESARASQQSGTTQQRLSASQNHTSVTRTVPDAAKTTTTGGQQPASPDSVNAGQPAKAQASASPPLPKAAHRVVQQTNKAATGVQAVFTAAVTPPPPLLPQQQQQQAVEQDLGTGLDLLEPLLPPEPSEGPEAHAEYQNYLHRWHNGDTIRQRWYR